MPTLTLAVMLVSFVSASVPQGRDTRTWYQAYEEGRRAVENNNFSAAVASLEAAKRSGPKPGRNINTYGDSYVTFNPDYYLGIAYLNLKRFADAVGAFQRAQQANLIEGKDRGTFTQLLSRATFEAALETAETALRTKQYDQAYQAALQASKMNVGGADAARAGALLVRIDTERTGPKPATPTPTPATSSTPTPTSPATPSPSPTTYVPASPTASPSPSASTTPTPRSTPTPTPTRTPPRPPDDGPISRSTVLPPMTTPERDAMILFFRGDYTRAAAELTNLTLAKPSARAFFYLACAQAGMALTGQGNRQTQLEAQSNFSTAVGDSDMFANDRKYVSPRILKLLGAKQ